MTDYNTQFAAFNASSDGAFATSRCLPDGLRDSHQEWCERGTINGKQVEVYWMFTNEEASVEDGADMPFDEAHVDRIETIDE